MPQRNMRPRIPEAAIAVLCVLMVAAAAAGFSVWTGGTAAGAGLSTASPTAFVATASPVPTPSPTASSTPVPTPTPTPTPDPLAQYFTSGDVQVDYDTLTYKSADLYVQVTNVNQGGQNYYVADCRTRDINKLYTAFAKDEFKAKNREKTSVMALRKGAVIAVDGDYCCYGGRTGIVIRNGQLYRSKPYHDVAAIFGDGSMSTYTKKEATADGLMAQGALQAWSFGPLMLDGNGQPLKKFSPPTIWVTNPRCGIGYIEPNHYVLIVVDGRRPKLGRKGMKQAEFAQLFADLGCKTAYNLDGGGSATMVFMGQVLNHPCDPAGERSVSDMVYFAESAVDQENIDRINARVQ